MTLKKYKGEKSMEVLVKKSNKANWKMVLKCTGYGNEQGNGRKGHLPCGAVLKIDADDIFLTFSGGNYLEEGDIIHYTCKCPECGSLTDIKESKLPEVVKEYASSMHHKKENGIEEEM